MPDSSYADKVLREFLQSLGYDGIQYENQFEDVDDEFIGNSSGMSYIAFESNQLKHADPITYDDNGNDIPLSERFNTEDDDIRYS